METTLIHIPENLRHFEWRPMRRSDASAMVRFYIACDAVDGTTNGSDEEDLLRDFDDPTTNVDLDTLIAVRPDGEVAALSWTLLHASAEHEHRVFLWGMVHPEYRRQGLGRFLLDYQERRGYELLAGITDDKPQVFRTHIPLDGVGHQALLESRGYKEARRFYRMMRDLSEPIPELPFPSGLSIHPFLFERALDILAADNEAFEDHWGHEPLPAELWQLWFVESPNLRPDHCLTALAGDQVAGGLICTENVGSNALTGRKMGWINNLFVRRPWRGMGLGSALLAENMRRLKESGFTHAGLGVDTENLTGALRIYENLGFKPYFTNIAYIKQVGPRAL